MKSIRSHCLRILPLAAVLAALALSAGCVTSTEVKKIVNNANYQALVASTPGLEPGGIPADGKLDESTEDARRHLSVFLEAHKDDKYLTGALRLRQALLYLNQRAFALAGTTITGIEDGDLQSPRDKAILAAFDSLKWWSEYAPETDAAAFHASQEGNARSHMKSLKDQADKLTDLPDLRDYFLEMRAWIGLKLALSTRDWPTAKGYIEEVVNDWTQTFSPAELAAASTPNGEIKSKPLDISTRRCLRLRNFLNEVASQYHGPSTPELKFDQRAVNLYYAAASASIESGTPPGSTW